MLVDKLDFHFIASNTFHAFDFDVCIKIKLLLESTIRVSHDVRISEWSYLTA
ncbi:Uncharacterised protein [Vibrio cholerae]|nr:Uncharacterised protein [Vibrio cholerae]